MLIYWTVWMFLPVWKLKVVWTVGVILFRQHDCTRAQSIINEKGARCFRKNPKKVADLFFYTSLPIFPLNSKKKSHTKGSENCQRRLSTMVPNRSQLKIVFVYYYGNFEQDHAPLRDFLWQKRIPFKISRSTLSWWHWSPPMRLWIIDSSKIIFSQLW